MKHLLITILFIAAALQAMSVKYEWNDFPTLDSLPANYEALPDIDLTTEYRNRDLSRVFALKKPKIVNLAYTLAFDYRPIGKYRAGDDEYILFYCVSGFNTFVFVSQTDNNGHIAESLLIHHFAGSWLRTSFETKGNEITVYNYPYQGSSDLPPVSVGRYALDNGFRLVEHNDHR